MKIWCQNGSEHSANLVMIGHFKDVAEAAKACRMIEELREHMMQGQEFGASDIYEPPDRYNTAILGLLERLGIYNITPQELEQFTYDVRLRNVEDTLVLRTEESEISAFLKVMIEKGARVEVFSAHDHSINAEQQNHPSN
jgi:hypothetical protein